MAIAGSLVVSPTALARPASPEEALAIEQRLTRGDSVVMDRER